MFDLLLVVFIFLFHDFFVGGMNKKTILVTGLFESLPVHVTRVITPLFHEREWQIDFISSRLFLIKDFNDVLDSKPYDIFIIFTLDGKTLPTEFIRSVKNRSSNITKKLLTISTECYFTNSDQLAKITYLEGLCVVPWIKFFGLSMNWNLATTRQSICDFIQIPIKERIIILSHGDLCIISLLLSGLKKRYEVFLLTHQPPLESLDLRAFTHLIMILPMSPTLKNVDWQMSAAVQVIKFNIHFVRLTCYHKLMRTKSIIITKQIDRAMLTFLPSHCLNFELQSPSAFFFRALAVIEHCLEDFTVGTLRYRL